MTRSLILAMALLFAATWAQAQREDTGQYSPGGEGKTQTVQGCLQGSGGNFTLTDSSGTVYRLLGDSTKLREHVGHEIEVTGPVNTVTRATSASTGAAAGSQTIDGKKVKHISAHCTGQ